MSNLPAAGVVLVGGRSSRMGRPKAWLKVGQETMAMHVASALSEGLATYAADAPAAGPRPPLIMVAAPGQQVPEQDGAIVVRDQVEGEGPLRGMEAGLDALGGRARCAFVASCDTPLLQAAFVARMLALLGDHDIAVPVVNGRHHPLAAVYSLSVLPQVRALLAAQRRRPFFLFQHCRTREVSADELAPVDPGLASLRNVNTPEDYQRLTAAGGGQP